MWCRFPFRASEYFEQVWNLKYFTISKIMQPCAALLFAYLKTVLKCVSNIQKYSLKICSKGDWTNNSYYPNTMLYTITVFPTRWMSTLRQFLLAKFLEHADENTTCGKCQSLFKWPYSTSTVSSLSTKLAILSGKEIILLQHNLLLVILWWIFYRLIII